MRVLGHLSAHFSTLGTTVVRATPGVLHAVVINQRGSNNSRVILTDGPRLIADLATGGGSVLVGAIQYEAHFRSNLTVQRVGGSAPDITVTFS